MHEQVTAVGPNGHNEVDLSVDQPGDSTPPERPAAKFVYPGGARPLEGYTIKRGVGHGGFGEIYYAVSDAGKEVALKLIRRNLEVELRGIRQCLNLKHPNLLSLYDIRQDDEGDTWVVMEYVSGGGLADAIGSHPDGMPTEEALAWLHGIGAGVAYLHDRGIVHRDLKPGNIFSDEGLVKVGDYGLSKFISCSRRSGQTESVGTVHYMAPEVANGRYGKEIDIYALGIILYEMLTGRVPFEGESVGEVLMKHLTAQPDVSLLAEPYRTVVARALEKDPAKRFKSVAEMLAALPGPAQASPAAGRLPSGASGTALNGSPPPIKETVINAQLVDEEPILKAVQETWAKLRQAWVQANLPTVVKVVLLLLLILLAVPTAHVWGSLALLLLILYAGYRLIRMLVISGDSSGRQVNRPGVSPRPVPQPPPPAAAPPRYGPVYARTRPRRRPKRRSREEAAAALVVKSPRERFTELVGSLLAGALVAVAMSVVMMLAMGLFNGGQATAPQPQQCAWLMLMAIAGTWAVLIPSKFWEGTRGEAVLRRFILMVVGLGLGAFAFGAATMLMVDLRVGLGYESVAPFKDFHQLWPDHQWSSSFYDESGRPLGPAYLACFGTLFLLIRWWHQADPLRSSRLSLWAMFVSLVAAALVAGVWGFEESSWLVMVAGAISVSVQLASPWLPPHKRTRRKKP